MSHSLKRLYVFTIAFSFLAFAGSSANSQRINEGKKKKDTSDAFGAVLGNSSDGNTSSGSTIGGSSSWQDQYADDLTSNAETIRNYRHFSSRDPDSPAGTALWVGGMSGACDNNEYVLVCEHDTVAHCVTARFPMDEKNKKENATSGCRYADEIGIARPTKNMIEMPAWHHDPLKCGFAEGANRLPCHYTWLFHDTTLKGIEANQNLVRRSAAKYTNYDNGGNGPHPDDELGVTWSNGKSAGEAYRLKHGWPKDPNAKLPNEPKQPVPPPQQQQPAPTDDCAQFLDSTKAVDCSLWDNKCKFKMESEGLTLCDNTCPLRQCTSIYESIAQPFSFGKPVDKAAFFATHDIPARAQAMQDAITNFRTKMAGNSFFGKDPDQCFFSRLISISTDSASVSSTCTPDPKLSLAQVSSDLSLITGSNAIPNYTIDNMRSEFNRLKAFAVKRVKGYQQSGSAKDSGKLALFLKDSNATSEQRQAALDLLNATNNLIFDENRRSFSDLVAADDPTNPAKQNRKYLVAGDRLEYNSSTLMNQIAQANPSHKCIAPPASGSSMDTFAQTFEDETLRARLLMNIQRTCHPEKQEDVHCPAGTDKLNHCKDQPLPQESSEGQH